MIATGCQGSRLAANVVGGVLCSNSNEKYWRFIYEKWLSDAEEDENIFKILRLSYNQLPSPPLKKCFAYCSIFPKGQRIVKEELIGLWMAERFLQANERDDMESVGDKIFNVLVHKSLLQIAVTDDCGNVLSCVMDKLAHDLASFVLRYFEDGNQIRYLIQGSPIAEGATKKYLRTLIFQGEITNTNMFWGFESLHALTLDSDQVKELPTSIRKLILLRNLNISRTQIEKLPDWICELYYLQTLNVSTESLRELPSTLKYLISLRHLYLCHDVELPAEIGRLTCLQTLRHFTVGGDKKGRQIKELGSLNKLKGKLVIHNLEKVRDKEEALKANLLEKPKLIELVFEWDADGEGERSDESVSEGLQPHANLNKLEIRGFRGNKFPSWIPDVDHSTNIILSGCQQCENIPKLGHLQHLKSLHLWKLCNVKSIGSSFEVTQQGDHIFPALESILLSYMPVLEELAEGNFGNEVNVFPRLGSLKIYHCYKLKCLPRWLFYKARNLKELDIRYCSKLIELPNGLDALNSLESITIKGCQNLESIPYPSGGGSLTSLASLEIRDCRNLQAMVESTPMPRLKKVSMAGLESLRNLHTFLDCLAKSPLLELTIVGVPHFISSPTFENWPFCGLQRLEMDVSRKWSSEKCKDIEEKVDGVSREWSSEKCKEIEGKVNKVLTNCSTSLGKLVLTGIESWEGLPDSTKELKSLSSLELENFGVGNLPEWFENLSSLRSLHLSNFTKLRCLPSLKAMQCLTKLKELHIRDCPKLRIESERYKILKGASIHVNGHKI